MSMGKKKTASAKPEIDSLLMSQGKRLGNQKNPIRQMKRRARSAMAKTSMVGCAVQDFGADKTVAGWR